YVKDSTAKAEMRKFEMVVKFFRKYGGQYRIEPLLMAAQGYQEAQLDQSKRSAPGAIGGMQVLPATGRGMAGGDICRTEPHVQAGVKYPRLMMDRYYANEPMSEMNKVLFAFAAYNAGPTRIAELRRRAKKQRLNPNVWFDNVEVVAAKTIGRE